jgi:hypothetical protein
MTRLTVTLAVWISLVPVVGASLAPRKPTSPLPREVRQALASRLAPKAPRYAVQRETRSEFVVTEQTEVLLNGKPCPYAAVPSHATIERMEVAEDRKTVLKIYFRARK